MESPMKKSKQSSNKTEMELKSVFIENAPEKYNRKALEAFFRHTIEDHKNEKDNFFFHRLNDFKKKIDKINNDWFSFFAEIHARYMIAEILKPLGYNVVFSKKDENDFCILKDSKKLFVEVKAIMPSDFQSDYDNFLKEIRKVPTGKTVSIRIKNDEIDKKIIFQAVKNKLTNLSSNYCNDDFEIKIIKSISNRNKTAFIGSVITFWVNQEGLVNVINEKLEDKPEQIKKANIICFYSFHNMFDAEDFYEAIKSIAKPINGVSNKTFLCFTPWNNGQMFAIIKKDNDWVKGDIKDCI